MWRAPPIPQRSEQLLQQSHKDVREWALLLCRCIALYKRPRDRRKLFIKSCTKTSQHLLHEEVWMWARHNKSTLAVATTASKSCRLYVQHLLMPSTRNRLWNWMQYNAMKEDRDRALFIFPMQTHKAYFHVSFPNKQSAHAVFFFLIPT